ncbi:MAG: glycoside hydrolase family 43 protein [Chloroflexota bacterium]
MTASSTYTNPVYPGSFADPFVMRVGDAYYAYGTDAMRDRALAFEVLRSTDLVAWSSLGRCLGQLTRTSRDYWAPEVVAVDGTFYLYYSVGVEDRGHSIRVATATLPEGPFIDTGRVLTPHERFAIDAHPFRDDDGQWYLFYARDRLDGERVGTSLAVDRLDDMLTLAGSPAPVLAASADWQLFKARRTMYGRVLDWYTLEGPFVVKRLGRYWCFYSGGAWTGAGYGISYAVADSPLGPWTEPSADGPALMRSRPGVLEGPGHNSVVTGPDGEDYVVYHAWDPAHTARRMCIDRLQWTAGGPRTAGPTVDPQPTPAG